MAPLPPRLEDPIFRGPLLEATREAVLLRVPTVGRFLVNANGHSIVEPSPGATEADVRCFRDESVAAVAAVLRGQLALTASAVAIDGRAVVLCGRAGAGKSATAAALALRGHPVLADAVTVISAPTDGGEPIVTPTGRELSLWPDVASELGLNANAGRVVRPALAKRAYGLGPAPAAAPAPVAAIVALGVSGSGRPPDLQAIAGTDRVALLAASRWHRAVAAALGQLGTEFSLFTQLASTGSWVQLVRPWRGSSPNALAKLVEDLLA
jgi:hypothetical protein